MTQELKLIALSGIEEEESTIDAAEAVYIEALKRVTRR